MKQFDYTPQYLLRYHEKEKTNSERTVAEALDLQRLEERALDHLENALAAALTQRAHADSVTVDFLTGCEHNISELRERVACQAQFVEFAREVTEDSREELRVATMKWKKFDR
ncbi:MAG: hypothetical protein QF541_06745 [Lentisphaeria bacterium]|nr:hypothetical protein [Lentisphaeria bacterium]